MNRFLAFALPMGLFAFAAHADSPAAYCELQDGLHVQRGSHTFADGEETGDVSMQLDDDVNVTIRFGLNPLRVEAYSYEFPKQHIGRSAFTTDAKGLGNDVKVWPRLDHTGLAQGIYTRGEGWLQYMQLIDGNGQMNLVTCNVFLPTQEN